jgi:hypothetical protein
MLKLTLAYTMSADTFLLNFRSKIIILLTKTYKYFFVNVQKKKFGQHESSNFFSPEVNIRLYDKNFESYYFFFLHQNQNMFFSNIGNQNIF